MRPDRPNFNVKNEPIPNKGFQTQRQAYSKKEYDRGVDEMDAKNPFLDGTLLSSEKDKDDLEPDFEMDKPYLFQQGNLKRKVRYDKILVLTLLTVFVVGLTFGTIYIILLLLSIV